MNLRSNLVIVWRKIYRYVVPEIVFAIVQGLYEFWDSVPWFISKFKKVKRLLLVDMTEDVTVHMREHVHQGPCQTSWGHFQASWNGEEGVGYG
jgi:hypothetical protein